MKLKFEKTMTCRLAARGKWGNIAAAWMGLSFFLRMVWYFGLLNLRDMPFGEIVFCVVLPLAVSVGFILTMKLPKFHSPIVTASLAVAFAVCYFFTETLSFLGVLSALALLAVAGLVLAAVLGYIPERKWLLWAGVGALALRILLVDLIGYLLPLSELNLIAYIPKASNLAGFAAVCFLCAALRLRKTA